MSGHTITHILSVHIVVANVIRHGSLWLMGMACRPAP